MKLTAIILTTFLGLAVHAKPKFLMDDSRPAASRKLRNAQAVEAKSALQASNNTRQSFELDTLEDFINNIDSRLKSVESKMSDVSSLKSQVANLEKRHCMTGEIGCNPCNLVDESGSTSNHKDVSKYITFETAFAKKPVVMLIHEYLWMKASGNEDWFGWVFKTSSVSKSGFQATVELWDTTIKKFWVQWVACSS